MSIRIIKAGLLSSVQDTGRHGMAALGIGHAGAMDGVALRLANALAGNRADAAAIEFTLIGPRLAFDADAWIALTGADFDARLDAAPAPAWQPLFVRSGCTLDIGGARRGARGYLAVHGGIAVPQVLGSTATDINAGLGPFGGLALRAGDTLAVQAPVASAASGTGSRWPIRRSTPGWSLDTRPWFDPEPRTPIRLIRATHSARLDTPSGEALFNTDFRIHPDSNRVGLRLDGRPLMLAEPLELVSEPVAMGTVQLPPGGQPIVLMAEHPTTGGYPRIGQVAAIDLPRLAQRRPGQSLRFSEIGLDEAQSRYLERERQLTQLEHLIARRLATHD